jgi:hypothetical protein
MGAPAPQKAERGETVALGYREHAIFDERLDVQRLDVDVQPLDVQFFGIGEDSRCPRNVTCFWQGQVKVLLRIGLKAGPAATHEVIAGESVSVGSWRLTVLEVQPERTSETPIPLEDYRILLKAE